MPEYRSAIDAERIGQKLIAEHHTRLEGIRVDFVFRDKASKSNGKIVLGKARKVSGLNAFLANDDGHDFFVIEIAEDEWEQMPPSKRRALVDHELCHCTIDFDEDKGVVTLGIKGHDVEAFVEEIERNGLWKDDLAEFAKAAKEQLELSLEEDAEVAP